MKPSQGARTGGIESKTMPKSKGRRKPHTTRHEDEEAQLTGPRVDWRKRIGWPVCFLGLLTFLGGYIGAITGLTFLPFEPHHMLTQLGGGVIAATGLAWATRGERKGR